METAIVLIRCPDRKGIVAKISEFVYRSDGNIIQSDQYTTDSESGMFFMRLEFCFDETQIMPARLELSFSTLAKELLAQWEIHYKSRVLRMGILVSKQDHCLFDILYRWKSGELNVNIPFVISNHRDAEELVWQFNIDFQYFSTVDVPKGEYEQSIIKCVSDSTDFLVLARYMQILSMSFLEQYLHDIINIHHSFLPSFKGANPYKQAYERGVKVIGATAHYVTEELDEGPIIDQVVEGVSHRDSVDDLVRKGRNLEKRALTNALHAHIEHRIIRYKNKTVVFM